MREFLEAKFDAVSEEITKLSSYAVNGDSFIKKRLKQLKDESVVIKQALYDLEDGLFPAEVEVRMVELRTFLKRVREGRGGSADSNKTKSPRKFALNITVGNTAIKAENDRTKDRPSWIRVVRD